jgi:DNA repair exonuclease SbcCD ATPase subunit
VLAPLAAAKQSEIDDLERKLSEARSELADARRARTEAESELERAAAVEGALGAATEELGRREAQAGQLEAQVAALQALLAETESKRDELFAMVDADLQVAQSQTRAAAAGELAVVAIRSPVVDVWVCAHLQTNRGHARPSC